MSQGQRAQPRPTRGVGDDAAGLHCCVGSGADADRFAGEPDKAMRVRVALGEPHSHGDGLGAMETSPPFVGVVLASARQAQAVDVRCSLAAGRPVLRFVDAEGLRHAYEPYWGVNVVPYAPVCAARSGVAAVWLCQSPRRSVSTALGLLVDADLPWPLSKPICHDGALVVAIDRTGLPQSLTPDGFDLLVSEWHASDKVAAKGRTRGVLAMRPWTAPPSRPAWAASRTAVADGRETRRAANNKDQPAPCLPASCAKTRRAGPTAQAARGGGGAARSRRSGTKTTRADTTGKDECDGMDVDLGLATAHDDPDDDEAMGSHDGLAIGRSSIRRNSRRHATSGNDEDQDSDIHACADDGEGGDGHNNTNNNNGHDRSLHANGSVPRFAKKPYRLVHTLANSDSEQDKDNDSEDDGADRDSEDAGDSDQDTGEVEDNDEGADDDDDDDDAHANLSDKEDNGDGDDKDKEEEEDDEEADDYAVDDDDEGAGHGGNDSGGDSDVDDADEDDDGDDNDQEGTAEDDMGMAADNDFGDAI